MQICTDLKSLLVHEFQKFTFLGAALYEFFRVVGDSLLQFLVVGWYGEFFCPLADGGELVQEILGGIVDALFQ